MASRVNPSDRQAETMDAVPVMKKGERMAGLIAPVLGKIVRSGAFSLPGDIDNHSRILVIDSGNLTELLFFSPVINQLKERFPGIRMTVLVREGNSELIRTMQQISEMITYEPAHLSFSSTTYFSLIKRIRARDFNVVFLLGQEFNFTRSLIALLTQARLRIGFTREINYPFINCELRRGDNAEYEATKAAGFLNAIGFSRDRAPQPWALPEQDLRWAKQIVHFRKPNKQYKLLVVDPGLGMGNHRLVDESFAFLVNSFCNKYPAKILVLSNNLDKKGIDKFKACINSHLLDLQPANIKEGLSLLSCADLFISGNTDYFHFAVSMKVPTLGLFTRHDQSSWFPKGAGWVQVLQGVKGQRLSLEEFFSKIDTLFHLSGVE
jgi:ADP-heptose:LPS heptosyltransferase